MALIKCGECGKEISDKANSCPNCSYPLKKEKAKENRKKILFQSKKISFKIFKIIIIVCIVAFILFSISLIFNHFERQKELKREQEIISKYIGGNITNIENKVWKRKTDDYYETYEFNDDYTCEYYKSGYTFEFNGETLPSFSESIKYYYKVEEQEENVLSITVFEIDFDTEDINTVDTLTFFPSKIKGNLFFNEKMYGDDNKMFLPDDKPFYEKINE